MSSWIQAIFGSSFGTAESETFGGAAFLSTRGVHMDTLGSTGSGAKVGFLVMNLEG